MEEIEQVPEMELEQIRKKQFLDSFEEKYKEDFLPAHWDEKRKDRVLELTDKQNTKRAIITAIPMVCRGSQCQFAQTCPLYQEDLHPLGERCPIEFGVVRHLMAEFIETLGVDVDNVVEMLLVRDMVDHEVQMLRASKLLAQEDFIQENVVGIDANGDPIMAKQLHLATNLQDKLYKRRQIAFKQFQATREERAKAGLAVLDTAASVSQLVHSFQSLKAEREDQLKKQLGIVEEDDYIEAKLMEKREE